jgi:hypothetical protein
MKYDAAPMHFTRNASFDRYTTVPRRVHGRARAVVLLIALVATGADRALGRRPDRTGRRTPNAAPSTTANGAFTAAIDEYKAAVRDLLTSLEATERTAAADLARRCDLYTVHLVTRRDLDASAAALDTLHAKIEAANLQLAEADFLAAEAYAPDNERRPGGRSSGAGLGGSLIIRSDRGSWSISRIGELERFFSSRFGRALPVSAYGQTELHDHLGWDHRNAVDVALSPDSVEGRAMLDYLGRAGIPYLAFRSAIPGHATGPHIHIGFPSHRLAR